MRTYVTLALSCLLLLTSFTAAHAKTKPKCATARSRAVKLASLGDGTVISFGIKGGNIRPWTVSIHQDGTITTNSWVSTANKRLTDPANALAGLATLAQAEGFFTMPATRQCSGTLPDVASRYMTYTTASGTTTVRVHGTCDQRFNQLWAVLNSVAGVTP